MVPRVRALTSQAHSRARSEKSLEPGQATAPGSPGALSAPALRPGNFLAAAIDGKTPPHQDYNCRHASKGFRRTRPAARTRRYGRRGRRLHGHRADVVQPGSNQEFRVKATG